MIAYGPFTQRDPIGLAGGINQYGYAGGDPVNNSDPFGLTPALACAVPAVLPICLSTGALVAAAAVTAVTSAALVLSGRHRQAVERTETAIEIAGEHIAAAGAGPPNDEEDPNWLKDKLDDAQKHVNNARKYVEKAVGRTKRELQRMIDEAQTQIDQLRTP